MTTSPTTPQEGASKTPHYFWKQCYEIGDSVHWALCDSVSEKEGKVSDCYMVLFADYPTAMDGRPVGKQDMLQRIADLLNGHAAHAAALQAAHQREQELRERLESVSKAANAFMDRCEATEGQAFYDRVRPEFESLASSLSHECLSPFGVWKFNRKGEPTP